MANTNKAEENKLLHEDLTLNVITQEFTMCSIKAVRLADRIVEWHNAHNHKSEIDELTNDKNQLEMDLFSIRMESSHEIAELTKEVERLRKEREWISIDACLPNYYDLCLLMNNESKDQEDNWVVAGYYNHKEEKFYNQFQDKYSDGEIFPTHWQPLPPINQ